jgi:hypothetical protein
MNHDDESAALAQKEMDERRRQEDELLANDPAYLEFLKSCIEKDIEERSLARHNSGSTPQ